jgi:bacteriocin-like protein
MSTKTLESTGNVSPNKKGMRTPFVHDLIELNEEELQLVTGGKQICFFGFCVGPGQLKKLF